jgi:hypothetical protein
MGEVMKGQLQEGEVRRPPSRALSRRRRKEATPGISNSKHLNLNQALAGDALKW